MKSFFLLLLLSSLQSVSANDGYAAVSAGGIVFQKNDQIKMKTEILTITSQKIEVSYEFINESDKEITGVVAFPTPAITCGYWGEEKGIDDFTAVVDGKEVKLEKEIKAFDLDKKRGNVAGIKEITKNILAAGLPLDCREVVKNPDLLAKAKKAKLADDYKGQDPEEILYTTKITYHWKQLFPSRKILSIRHAYTPILGAATGLADYDIKKNLFWDKDIGLVKTPYGMTSTMVGNSKRVEYILLTALTWKGPIESFTLILKKEKMTDLLGSSLGPLRTTDNVVFEYKALNFKPTQDLYVIFATQEPPTLPLPTKKK